jgi:hypothetical protein
MIEANGLVKRHDATTAVGGPEVAIVKRAACGALSLDLNGLPMVARGGVHVVAAVVLGRR